MQVVAPLSESEVGHVKVGQIATVTVEALEGRKLAAHVGEVAILSTSNSGVVSYNVTFQLDQMESGLKPGMSATAEAVVNQAEGVNVPTSAITAGSVTVVKNGTQTRRRVVTGLAGNSSTIILSRPERWRTGRPARFDEHQQLERTRRHQPGTRHGPCGRSWRRSRWRRPRWRGLPRRRWPLMARPFRPHADRGPRVPRPRPLIKRALPRRDSAGREVRRHPVIQLHEVTKIFELGQIRVRALLNVSLRIDSGDFVAIMGSSGSGKSTLMNILGCLDVPTSGRYLIDGMDVSHMDADDLADLRNRKIGFIFQSFNLVPRTSALVNVELPLAYAGVRGSERRRRAERALSSVGMANRIQHMPAELSGGQQQRVAVARAIVTNPSLILADEPTGNLDSRSTEDVLRIFARLNDEGRTVVLITHEPDVAAQTKRVIRLSDGEVVEDRRSRGVHDAPPALLRQKSGHRPIDAGVAEARP